jgi:primosomal protein N''
VSLCDFVSLRVSGFACCGRFLQKLQKSLQKLQKISSKRRLLQQFFVAYRILVTEKITNALFQQFLQTLAPTPSTTLPPAAHQHQQEQQPQLDTVRLVDESTPFDFFNEEDSDEELVNA